MEEINVSPDKYEKKAIPPDLKSAIVEARRYTGLAGGIIRYTLNHGYREAIERLGRGPQEGVDAFSFLTIYSAIQGDIYELGDLLQVAIDKPELCGDVTPGRMYALLALAYESRIPIQDSIFELESDIYRIAARGIDEQLDNRNLLKNLMNDFKIKAGEEYQKVKDLAKSPTFAKFKFKKCKNG